MELDKIYNMDCMQGLKQLADESIEKKEEKEMWKDVVFNNNYQVSNMGNVLEKGHYVVMKNGRKRYRPQRMCKIFLNKIVPCVTIGGKSCSIMKLVYDTFVPHTSKTPVLHRKNGDVNDNRLCNISDGFQERIMLDDNYDSEIEFLKHNYDVSRNGEIIRLSDGKKMEVSLDNKGYYRVRLLAPSFSKNKDRRKPYKVHRLVAMFYLDDFSDDLQVNHKNGIKTDNRVENLEMVTNQQNVLHAWRVLDSTKRRKLMAEIIKRRNLSNSK